VEFLVYNSEETAHGAVREFLSVEIRGGRMLNRSVCGLRNLSSLDGDQDYCMIPTV
jgi:hypothetical protein